MTGKLTGELVLPTEWNQIETTLSLAYRKPTLALLHNRVARRGVFEAGSANLFVYHYNFVRSGWRSELAQRLDALRSAVDA